MKVPSTFTSKESIQRNIRIWAITYVKRRWLMQIHAIFKKILFTHVKSIYFCFEAPTKPMLVFFRTRLGKKLMLQKV